MRPKRRLQMAPRGGAPETETFPSCEIRDSRVFFAGYGVVAASVATGLAASGWVAAAVVASIYVAWAAARMIVTPVRVRVSDAGIEDRSFWYSAGFIPWSEIVEIRAGPWGAIEIELRDESSLWERLGPLRQMSRAKLRLFWGLGPAAIIPWGLQGSRERIVEALQAALDTFVHRSLTESTGDGDGHSLRATAQ